MSQHTVRAVCTLANVFTTNEIFAWKSSFLFLMGHLHIVQHDGKLT